MTCQPMWLVAVVACIAWSVQGQTDSPTDASTDEATDAPTQAPTGAPTQSPTTVAPTIAPTEAATDSPTEAPTEPGDVATFYSDIRVKMFSAFDTDAYKQRVMNATKAGSGDVKITVTYLMKATYAFSYVIPENKRRDVFAQSLGVPKAGIQVTISRRLAEDGARRLSDTTYEVEASTTDQATANNMETSANQLSNLEQAIQDNTGATVSVPNAPTLEKDVKIATEVAINSNTQSQAIVETAFQGLDNTIRADENVVSTVSYVNTPPTYEPTQTPTPQPTNQPTYTPTSQPTGDLYFPDDNHAVGLAHSLTLVFLCLAVCLQ